jgi:hypothetical protein
VKGDNFYSKCTIPYWHEAHHVIPNSVLRAVINGVGKDANAPEDLVRSVRRGLLKEKYNLNHRSNMITLPLDPKVSAAIRLPLHRQTAAHREHRIYSKYVQQCIEPIFKKIQEDVVKHEKPPDFADAKEQLDINSAEFVEQIRASMGEGDKFMSLDQRFN